MRAGKEEHGEGPRQGAVVGVISDTHGYLDPRVPELFAGVEHIVHAGDVGDMAVVEKLAQVAPVTVVSGNMDRSAGPEVAGLPSAAQVDIAGLRFLVAHIKDYVLRTWDPAEYGVAVVLCGHTHRAAIEERDGVLYVNPGVAGRAPAGVARSIAFIEIVDGRPRARIVPLDERAPASRGARAGRARERTEGHGRGGRI